MNHAANGTGPFAPSTDNDWDVEIDDAMMNSPNNGLLNEDEAEPCDRRRAAALMREADLKHSISKRHIIHDEAELGSTSGLYSSPVSRSRGLNLSGGKLFGSRANQKGNARPSKHQNMDDIRISGNDDSHDERLNVYGERRVTTIGGVPINRRMMLVALACMMGIIVVLSVTLSINGEKIDQSSTSLYKSDPNNVDSNSETYNAYYKLIVDESLSDEELLKDSTTPQARALHWLVNDDTAAVPQNLSTAKTKYSLLVFYFANIAESPQFQLSIPLGQDNDPDGIDDANPQDEIAKEMNEFTSGENWLTVAAGHEDADIWYCRWIGIKCDTNNRGVVKEFNLTKRGLVGKIPEEFGRGLTSLRMLDLGYNQLSGSIPVTIAENTSMLEQLYLGNNQLTGSIPTQIGNMVLMEDLYLQENFLTGKIPQEIGQLVKLDGLGLYGNELSGQIPSQIGNLLDLYVLYLDDNWLSGQIPSTIGNLQYLSDLRFRKNRLSGTIPEEIQGMNNLEMLYLDENFIEGSIPEAIGSLKRLTQIQLYKNKLTGTIPEVLGELEDIELLYLDNNELRGEIPTTIGRLTNMEALYLFNNKFTGTIPFQLGNLEDLKSVRINDNLLSGSIPPEFGSLTKVELMYMHNNQLTGLLPEEMGEITRLGKLRIDKNRFDSQVIPQKICMLTSNGQLDEFAADCEREDILCECCTECL